MGKTDFIVIGTLNGCMRLSIFPHFVDRTIFFGLESPKTFVSRDGTETKFGNIKWFTTFDMPRKPLPPLSDKCPCAYERFINAPGINVTRLNDIPRDYYGVVGVPITFLEHDYGDWTILNINLVPRLEGGVHIQTRVLIEKHSAGFLSIAMKNNINPPFSLFREYVKQLMDYGKKFIIVGNMNAVDYKEIFPLIRDNQMWLGASKGIGWKSLFLVPDNYEGNNVVVIDGKKYAQNNTAAWFTNVEHKKRNTPIDLCKRYSNEYKHYDNYDAIEVGKISDIPIDYDGVMGVPLTFFFVYCPKQFEIIGNGYTENIKGVRPYVNGKRLYSRIFIRKRTA